MITKSERNSEDNRQILGKGCKNTTDRLLAAIGMGPPVTNFKNNNDVDNGGLLLALPSLLSNGLLNSINSFNFCDKYYRIQDIFIVIAFMILARIKNINQLGNVSPGEWGSLIGLDRIPERKILRQKIDLLSHGENEKNLDQWTSQQSSEWINTPEDIIGHFYLDGHVRTYFGNTTKLPYRYVPRQKLCLRGMTDYWVNEESGKPLFSITTPFSKGLIEMLKKEIIPKLLELTSENSSELDFEKDKDQYRFVVIFDREGYSMNLFKELWEQYRIACQTYNKYPKEDWNIVEFYNTTIKTTFRNKEVKIAERNVCYKKTFWYREIRELTNTGHQVSVCTTDFKSSASDIYMHMRGRSSQENFFRYARQEYNIDTLTSYEKTDTSETTSVINPKYRNVQKQLNSDNAKLGRRILKRSEMSLKDNPSEKEIKKYEEREGELTKEIEELKLNIHENKENRKEIDKHILVKDLPDDYKFVMFHGGRKKFIDTIKMIVYRAEISMANIILPLLTKHDKDTAKAIIKSIFKTPANIFPDYKKNKLNVELHFLNRHKDDKIVKYLIAFLNKTEYVFPGTNLKLFYKLGSN